MTVTPESLKSDLAGVAKGLAAGRTATEEIRRAGADRMAVIDKRLAELRPATLTNEASAREYSDLIEERGTIALVLGQAAATS